MKYVRGYLFGKNVKIYWSYCPEQGRQSTFTIHYYSPYTPAIFPSVESFFWKNNQPCNFGNPNLSIISG